MRSLLSVVAVALVVAGSALAGGRKDQEPPKTGSGVFVAATPKPGAGTFELKVALDNEGEKLFELPAQVAVMYTERNGQRQVHMVRVPGGKRAPDAKGKALIAQGTLVKAETQGANVVLTLKVGEGDAAAEQQFTMPRRIQLAYHNAAGKLAVQHINAAGKRDKADKGGKRERAGKGHQGDEPPENF
ncbi:MAG TPA: hypothetical protein VNE39_24660 [Planctomycetota bacterium]|nr:hypothetical protein [Planctomycetota bacterium]